MPVEGWGEGSEGAILERQLCKELVPRFLDVHLFFDKNLWLLSNYVSLKVFDFPKLAQ